MVNLERLAKKILRGREVTLSWERYDDGTEEEPDVVIDHVWASAKVDKRGNKTIRVYLSKEDDKNIFETEEIYRIPYISDVNVLKYFLKEAKEQFHYSWGDY